MTGDCLFRLSDSLTSHFCVRNPQGISWRRDPESPLTENTFTWGIPHLTPSPERKESGFRRKFTEVFFQQKISEIPQIFPLFLLSPLLLSLHLCCIEEKSFYFETKLPGVQILPALYFSDPITVLSKNKNKDQKNWRPSTINILYR